MDNMMETIGNILRKHIPQHHDKNDDPNQVWNRIRNNQLFLPVPSNKDSNTNDILSTANATGSSVTDDVGVVDSSQQHEEQQSTTTTSGHEQNDAKNDDHTPAPMPIVVAREREDRITRIACMSDTHGRHRKVFVPKCDILIHAGDLTMSGEICILKDLADFFCELVQEKRVGKVICIAGNHDLIFDPETLSTRRKRWIRLRDSFKEEEEKVLDGEQDESNADTTMKYFKQSCIYLQDECYIHNDDIEFYGSPWTPVYGHGWAFMKDRQTIHEKWDAIPESVDVLITHGPPLGRGDKVFLGGSRAGCANLLSQIQTRIRPRLCVFGHIHEDAGVTFDGKTLYVNAANVTIRYNPQQPCVVIDLPSDPKEVARVVRPRCKLTGEEILSWLGNHGYINILPFFERCDPLLDGNDLIGPQQQQQPNFEIMLTEKLKLNQQFLQRDFVSSFSNNTKKIKEELVTAMLHLQSISYD